MKTKFLLLYLLILLGILLPGTPVQAQLSGGTDFATAVEITTIETELTISASSGGDYFTFTVPETASYSIYTTGGYDTWAMLYDASQVKIAENDDYSDLNFKIIKTLDPGQYYLRIGDFDMMGIPSVMLYIEGTGFAYMLPQVTTSSVGTVGATSSNVNGEITDLGYPNPTAHGMCWNTTGDPTVADNATDEGAVSATGSYQSDLTGLSPNTQYYVRAYVTNDAGTSYGNTFAFQTAKKELTVSGSIADDKVYDGTADALISNASLEGVLAGDDVSIASAVGSFTSKDVGTGISVTPNITLTGADAGNYSLTQPTGLSADITAKALTVSGATAENKIYDGTTDATITGTTLNGLVSGDDASLDASTGSFASADVGTGIVVTPALTLTGADAGNYSLTQPTGLSADITAKELIITGTFEVEDKEYDGTTDATISVNDLFLNGIVGDDNVSILSVVAEFTSAEVNSNITVYISDLDLAGEGKSNYTVDIENAPTTTASIYETTDIDDPNEVDVKVYPNPGNGNFYFEISESGAYQLRVVDLAGKVVFEKSTSVKRIALDLSSCENGIYILHMVKDRKVIARKIIKQ